MCMDLVLNKDKHPDILKSLRGVCSFLAKKLGMSKEDLPQVLKQKVDELGHSSSGSVPYQGLQ